MVHFWDWQKVGAFPHKPAELCASFSPISAKLDVTETIGLILLMNFFLRCLFYLLPWMNLVALFVSPTTLWLTIQHPPARALPLKSKRCWEIGTFSFSETRRLREEMRSSGETWEGRMLSGETWLTKSVSQFCTSKNTKPKKLKDGFE